MAETKPETQNLIAGNDKGTQVVIAGKNALEVKQEKENLPSPILRSSYDQVLADERPSSWLRTLSFVLIVIMPTLLVGWFLKFEASERFTGEFRVAIKSLDAMSPAGAEGLLRFAGIGASSSNESHAVVQFLESREVIDALKQSDEVTFDNIFAREGQDFLSTLEIGAPIETQLEYWNRFVDVRFETSSTTVIVKVTAFTPQDTLYLSEFLLNSAEKFVNQMSLMARQDAVFFAKQELETAEGRMMNARLALTRFQEQEHVLDPFQDAESSQVILAGLKEKRVQQRLALVALRKKNLSDDGILVQKTLSSIANLEEVISQIEEEATVGTKDNQTEKRPLTQIMLDFTRVTNEAEFSEKAYLSAMTSLEMARIEADRQKMFLATIVSPGLPEKASFPKPVSGTLIALALCLAIWVIGLIGYFTIREHA